MTQEQEQKSLNLSRLAAAISEVISFDPDVIHALNDLRPKIDREKRRDVDANIRRLAETNYQELMAAYYNTRDELTPEEVAILESGIHEFKPLFVLGDKVFRTRSIISEMVKMADQLSFRAEQIIERKPAPEPTATPTPRDIVCPVCEWKHTADFTRWENPHTGTVTLIGAGTKARTFLEGLHTGMKRDGRDVATAAAMGDKKSKAPRVADIMGDKESVLFQSTGRGRGKIRPPDPGKAKKPRPKR